MDPMIAEYLVRAYALNTLVIGMQAENQSREHRGESLAYKEDDFAIISSDLVGLAEQIRNRAQYL